jgi:hypothetical protein
MVQSLARAERVRIEGSPSDAAADPNQATSILSRAGLVDDDELAS